MCNQLCKHILSRNLTPTSTHPIFVIHHIAQHIILVQNTTIAMFQPVHLNPVAGVLGEEKKKELKYNLCKEITSICTIYNQDL